MKAKKSNFSEWYTELTKEAELCDIRYPVKGFVVFQPNSVLTMKEMYRAYEQALEANGHLPAWFPALVPESNFTLEGKHVEGFVPEVFWVTGAGNETFAERLALRPTSETVMYQMYSQWIQGAKDLPLKIYQSCQVWRCETKATRPFLRSREFHWIEAHDVFATREQAEAQVLEDMQTTEAVMHAQFGIPFLFFRRPEWDKFPGAVDTYAADTLMPDGRVLQLPSTHMLGQNFSKPFNVKYQNAKGEMEYCWQTCYGPAISRIYAAIISIHGDDRGLVLPFKFASVQVVIVPILGRSADAETTEKIHGKARELEAKLKGAGLRAKADFSDSSPGFKYNHWEFLGVPVRVELGANELAAGTLTVVRRDVGKRETIHESGLPQWLAAAEKELLTNLLSKADADFSGRMHAANSLTSLATELDKGGFAAVPFCSREMAGKACAEKVKGELRGDVRGTLHAKDESPAAGAKCIACGAPATCVVYVARQY